MLRLADLLSDIANSMGYYYNSSSDTDIDSDTTNKPRQKQMKRLINDAYLAVMRMMPKDFLRTKKIIRIPAAYTTGTIAITQSDPTATGTGTTFTRFMQMRQLLVDGDYKPYFIKTFTSTTVLQLLEAFMHATVSGESYTIASWAIPVPGDFLAPVDEKCIMNIDNNSYIPLMPRKRFRDRYLEVYQTGVPSVCCIDGQTRFPRQSLTGDCSVTNGSATVTVATLANVTDEDLGSVVKIEGDSVPYRITAVSDALTTFDVSPVVQRASDTSLNVDIDPAPLPLIWFDAAPSSELRIGIDYYRKPEYLWTDEQTAELAGDYELAFRKMAMYLVLTHYSRDQMQKQEALAEFNAMLKILPKHIDTTPIMKEINNDAYLNWPGITFPNVGIAT